MADQEAPRLVVGLGNPGREYERTRHNAGFMVVDEIASRNGLSSWKTKDSARQIFDSKHRVVLVEPTSFMNLSGTPVRLISSWYRTPPEGVLVIVDDMDLPFGSLRMRPFGGHGGHNGLRSIIATIGDRFPRIRVGVGRPEHESIDHVLSPFSADERNVLPRIIQAAADGAQLWLDDGLEAAMQFVNNWVQQADNQ
ncbi:MAG TPA: aminoacyl-tRNA hydrolase [Alphaproteobacteria bacterium]|nr:aminoacyl-tRNA hydrolase [Alphaproteobacteria bacterium]